MKMMGNPRFVSGA